MMPLFGNQFRRIDVLELFRTRFKDLFCLTRFAYYPATKRLSNSQNCRSSTPKLQARLNEMSVLYLRSMIEPLRRLFSWGVPTSDTLEFIQLVDTQYNISQFVEVGAGTGYWGFLLRQRNMYIIPIDANPCHVSSSNGFHTLDSGNVPPFCRVLEGRPDFLRRLVGFRNLFLCWPPRERDLFSSSPELTNLALNSLTNFQGDTLLFVGEGLASNNRIRYHLSCPSTAESHRYSTAGPTFNHAVVADWNGKGHTVTPKWPGSYDVLTFWEKVQHKAGQKVCSISSQSIVVTEGRRTSRSVHLITSNDFICTQFGFMAKQTVAVDSARYSSQARCPCARTHQLSEFIKTWAGQMATYLNVGLARRAPVWSVQEVPCIAAHAVKASPFQIPSTSFSYHATLDSISRSMQVIVLALGLFPTNNQLRTEYCRLHWLAGMETDPMNKKNTTFEGLSNETLPSKVRYLRR